MVVTRSKTRKASTSLSSPPPSPAPSLQSSSASNRTASAQPSSRTGLPYADTGRKDANVHDHDSDNNHEDEYVHDEDCQLHSNESAISCNATTYAHTKCTRKAKVFNDGYLPVCGSHRRDGSWLKAGKCQAIERCGQLCNRLAPHAPPYHLCAEHQKGTDTLPCHVIRLPIELRLMIFRYLLPDVVRADKFDRSKGALLRVNRQFYQEASSVIYGEARFEVLVASTHISMFGKKWWREPSSHSTDSFKEVLCQAGAQRIRTLEVEVRFSRFRSRPKFLGKNDVSYEDYDLYQLRDSVRKLVQLLYAQFPEGNTKALRRLEVKPILSVQHPWQADEFAAATFVVLEPFLFLSPVDELKLVPPSRPEGVYMHERDTADTIGSLRKNRRFCSLAKEWRTILEGTSTVARNEQPHRQNQPHGRFAALYRRIEDFARVISKQDSAPESGTVQGHKWGSSVFQGMERVLHLARLAYEHEDEKRLEQIRNAIMIRWVNAQRQEQRALTEVANSISGMFIGYLQDSPQNLYPNEFIFPSDDLIEQENDATQLWPELGAEDTAPQIGGHGVKFSEDNLRVYIRKRGNLFIRLKTPAMVRHLRKIKEDGDDSE